MAQRGHRTAKFGGVAAFGVLVLLTALTLACRPEQTHHFFHVTRQVPSSTTAHLTVRLSRSAVAQSSGLAVELETQTSDVAVDLVPDDPAFDGMIERDFPPTSALRIADLAAICPPEGSCDIGLTAELGGRVPSAVGIVSAVLTKPVANGTFTADATLEIIFD